MYLYWPLRYRLRVIYYFIVVTFILFILHICIDIVPRVVLHLFCLTPLIISYSSTSQVQQWSYLNNLQPLCSQNDLAYYKNGTNLEFHSNWISNQISLKFQIEYQIKYEYLVISNSIKILNGIYMSSRDTASTHNHGHKPELESSASWPCVDHFVYLLTDLTMKTTSYSCQTSHILYVQ